MNPFYSVRTLEEVDELYRRADDSLDIGATRYTGMSYEDGILAAIDYLEGNAELDEVMEVQ